MTCVGCMVPRLTEDVWNAIKDLTTYDSPRHGPMDCDVESAQCGAPNGVDWGWIGLRSNEVGFDLEWFLSDVDVPAFPNFCGVDLPPLVSGIDNWELISGGTLNAAIGVVTKNGVGYVLSAMIVQVGQGLTHHLRIVPVPV